MVDVSSFLMGGAGVALPVADGVEVLVSDSGSLEGGGGRGGV